MSTKEPRFFCHLGNPKACSTSIQQLLLAGDGVSHHYVGFRPDSDPGNWYLDRVQARLLNLDLRFTSSMAFETRKEQYRHYIQKWVERCQDEVRDLWISSENLSMKFIAEDIDVLEKFRRLQLIVPAGTSFVVVFRNIYDSLRSIYKEYVKQGYGFDFTYFCNETFLYRDANFLSSLFPGALLRALMGACSPDNRVEWCFLGRQPENDLGLMLRDLTGQPITGISHLNEGLGDKEVAQLMSANATDPFVADATGLMETHRALWHLEADERVEFERFIWQKLRHHHRLRSAAQAPSTVDVPFFQMDISGTHLGGYLRDMQAGDAESLRIAAGKEPCQDYHRLWYDALA